MKEFFKLSPSRLAEIQNENDKKTNLLNERYKETNSHLITPDDFDIFWELYLSKEDICKEKTQNVWNILCKKETRPTLTVIRKSLHLLRQTYDLSDNHCVAEYCFRSLSEPYYFLDGCYWNKLFKETEDSTLYQSNYIELLKHPKWQRKKLEIMQRDNFTCTECKDDNTTLHVHHKKYISGKKPWEYEDDDLITLCENCHTNQHQSKL